MGSASTATGSQLTFFYPHSNDSGWKRTNDGSTVPCYAFSYATSLYSTILALVSVSANWRWSYNSVRHLKHRSLRYTSQYMHIGTFIQLGTFALTPQDKDEALAGVIIPLTVPRKYIPIDPKSPKVPTPEQTSYYSPNFSYDDLPPLSDYDYADYLTKRNFHHFDPTIIVKRRNAFFSILRVFAKEIASLSVLVVLQTFLEFTTPIGVKNLLEYLETKGVGAFFKPWVWIVGIFIGRILQTMASEMYLYISTRQVVQAKAILTETILEHALRIRVKAETSDEKPFDPTPSMKRLLLSSGTSSPADEGDEQTLHSATPLDARSRDATLQAGSSSASRRTSSSNLQKDADNAKSSVPELVPPLSTTPVKPKAETKNILGKVNNLITTDMQNIMDGKDVLRLVIQLPIRVTLCVFFLYKVLGWSAFVGLAIRILLFPLPTLFTKMIRTRQKIRMMKTDARIQMVTETMNVMRLIKVCGWETLMNSRIKDAREEELSYIRKLRQLELATGITNYTIGLLTMLATYGTYTVVMKQELSASKVFSSMVVFKMIGSLMHQVVDALTQSVNAKVSLDRVTEFLYETELLDSFTGHVSDDLGNPSQEIGFRNATFSWSNDYSGGSSKRQFFFKIDGELIFKRDTINLILGGTGSGKTSMLMALLSEMHFIPSEPDSWYNLPRTRGVAYAAQESWVQNATIKENILFGLDLDEERYKKVLYQCALERDLELFQAGDETEVGEKGLTLSGGQKARVTLARAIYSKADIVLLDDVLAALDVHTSKWIVDKCLKGDLVKDRTILMVTHNVALVQSIAGFVVSIKDGRILSQGTVSEALSHDKVLASQFETEASMIESAEEIDADDDKTKKATDGQGKLIIEEEVQVGNVGWLALRLLFKGLGGRHVILFFVSFIGCFIISESSETFQPWFLGYWASQYEIRDPSQVDDIYYLTGYTMIMILQHPVLLSIHKQLVQSVLGTTMRWLDTTPTSRVITRCTQDMRDIDGPLLNQLSTLTRLTIIMVVQFCSIIYLSPAFLLPGFLVSLAGALCGSIYIKAQLPIKRVQSNAQAPVLGHFGTIMAGLVSVRAYGVQQRFIEESLTRINYYSRPSRVFYNLNRWIDVRLDLLGNIFSAGLAAYLVYFRGQTASNTGFSLNLAVLFTSSILHYIRIMNDFQIKTNSLERINAYIEIEQEPRPTKGGVPPAYWPSSGDLRVEKLNAKYSPGGPQVLQDINFHVKSGERIGVVGRTGSGKSTLMLSLLRCIYTGGEVYLDGIPTSTLNLDDLRTKITIIPQMPELLSGTVRRNLDPFDQYDDVTLYDALRSAGLYSVQSEDEDARIGLDTAIASGGGNLSVGQRQILALARAMVRESKLLILDEATSAIDYKTDAVIQSSLRHELKGDVTLITVAHRLQTIMDADKIMVLDAGRIVEYDSPKELLKNEAGHLRALVDESADKEHLRQMAEGVDSV
ncbi:P-loop containing nucleoside triphosphate hydrolase protein [Gymnopus androsaceus JB14]|uniref:P-loop containing nucleoside triphosphate hydrolase protein n=1 Tax=Gymnopus androsaceus JB14 TaxID=1447944 RepID=A0A6A4I6D9_9AGAR|nr:P-loop containing nucleoside triphosphate hydrolase protein [Gymnopus androsaceus JB14]